MTVVVCLGVLLAAAPPARALEPWWHVNTISAPAAQPGGESLLIVEASNLGDAKANSCGRVARGTGRYANITCTETAGAGGGEFESLPPIVLTDTLPAGVTALNVHGEGGGGAIGEELSGAVGHSERTEHCAIAGQRVTCSYDGPLLPYERLMVAIDVHFEPGAGTGSNEVRVSGGGASPLLSRHPLALSESAPSFGVENSELSPEEEGGAPDTQAGSHPFQLTSTLTLNTKAVMVNGEAGANATEKELRPEAQPVELPKDLRFDLPPGLVGNPTPLPKCATSVFLNDEAKECPDDTVIGVAAPIAINTNKALRVPGAVTFPLYSLEPVAGEPARFGFYTPVGPVLLDTSVSGGRGYRVVVSVSDILDQIGVIGSQVTFWGVPGDPRHDRTRSKRGGCLIWTESPHDAVEQEEPTCPVLEKPQPFLDLPASCTGRLSMTFEADSWDHPGLFIAPVESRSTNSVGEPYAQDGCNRLGFNPSIGVAPDGQQASTPTGLTVGVHVDQQASLNPTGLADATVKDTTVALPAGVELNPSGADGLLACGLGEIRLESESEQSCPEAAKVGTVEIETPLLPNKLQGAAYLATPAPFGEAAMNPFSSLLALYLVARDPVSGVLVKLAGQVSSCEAAGQTIQGVTCQAPAQLISTFKETPQLPFENLRLHFFGGSRAPLGTPALCGTYTTTASIAPWSGNPPAGSSSQFQITSAPNGGPCANPLPFGPELHASSSNIQAGTLTPFSVTMTRPDGNQNLQAIGLHMPPGLSGVLSGVKLCAEAQANAGTCPPESEIGETIVSVGLGSTPFTVTGGKVYLTASYEGAPFGLSIVNPADAGPFHLGNVVVRAKVEVDPLTAALTVTTNASDPHAIPQFIKGIPLQIKHVNVTINRPGFTFNPTSCDRMAVTGSLQSAEGATGTLSVPFQVTNCAALAFKPSFHASVTGNNSKAAGAALKVNLAYPNAPLGSEANLHAVKVELPLQLPSRLTTLQKACLASVFEANPAACPAASIVGHATAVTPILPVALAGPAYFVSYGNAKFPELVIVLQGYGVTIQLHGETFIDKHGVTSSTFKAVPDQPVTSFELTLPQGPYSALTANANLCTLTHTTITHKTVTRKVQGHNRRVRVTVRHATAAGLAMPTEITAQDGTVIKQATPIAVTGCAKATKARKAKHATSRQKHR